MSNSQTENDIKLPVLLDLQPPLATITLNRPDRLNSLVPAMLEQLLSYLHDAAKRPEIKVAILSANGPSFSAGSDAAGFYEQGTGLEAYSRSLVGILNQVILTLLDLPIPVITAVKGPVSGGSIGLVLASDIVFVTPTACFTPSSGGAGFSPDGGWTAMLPNRIGTRRASEILMTNRTISAGEAVQWGLANKVLPAEDIDEEIQKIARTIAGQKSGVIQHTKRLLTAERDRIAVLLETERIHFVAQIAALESQGRKNHSRESPVEKSETG